MVNKLTASQLFKKPLQFLAESVEGTTPTTGTWTNVGQVQSLGHRDEGNYDEIGQIGSEDLTALAQGLQRHRLRINYRATDPSFIKRAINAQNYASQTGNIWETLSILFSIYLNGVENYILLKGARPVSCGITAEIGKATEFNIEYAFLTPVAPSATEPVTGTTKQTAFSAAAVYGWLSGTNVTPLRWGGDAAGNSVAVKRFEVTIDRGTNEDFALGNKDAIGTLPHARRIKGSFDTYWNIDTPGGSTLEADFRNGTDRSMKYYLKDTTDHIDFGSACRLTNRNIDHDTNDTNALIEKYDFTALTAVATP